VRVPLLEAAPSKAPPAAPAFAPAPAPPAPPPGAPALRQAPAGFDRTWTVQPGETLWAIARRHGTTPELLAAANGRRLDDLLKAGDTLNVPAEEP
jgi:nucleoid-associated protein YgaU